MKTLEKFLSDKEYCLPFTTKDLQDAYKLGQINILLELEKSASFYPVNGLVKAIVTEKEIHEKLIEVSNG